MNIYDEFAPYLDEYGFIEPWTGGDSSGNGPLYTAQYVAALVKHKALLHVRMDEFFRMHHLYKSCELQPGLPMRTPKNEIGQESLDNVLALIYADTVLGTNFSVRFLEYGKIFGATKIDPSRVNQKYTKLVYNILSLFGLRKIKKVYNNENPGTFSLGAWFGRFPILTIAALYVSAHKKVNILYRVWYAGAIYLAARCGRKEHDGRVHTWLMIKIAGDKMGWLERKATEYWRKKLLEHFPDGIGGLLEDYFQDSQHPSVRYLRGELG